MTLTETVWAMNLPDTIVYLTREQLAEYDAKYGALYEPLGGYCDRALAGPNGITRIRGFPVPPPELPDLAAGLDAAFARAMVLL